ncbi:28S ribosomal protein S18c, mitochondrial-like [Nannospalax galili]|uniref:28S ribosomal protein S18c, mitochondrial-like n=1 Tax=Nannospalax galili TaxID=1026970 RepID=UPI00111C46BA|nr:28S ribosomal protein S18c, mitochondrial-like [Nannospalax galili]
MHRVTIAICPTGHRTDAVPWRRGCSQHKQVTINEDLPNPMENACMDSLKKCILHDKYVGYKNVRLLLHFISPFIGCMFENHIRGSLWGKKQKEITKAIQGAQIIGLL